MVIQWLRLQASNAGDVGSIPGQGTRYYMLCSQVFKKKLADNELN